MYTQDGSTNGEINFDVFILTKNNLISISVNHNSLMTGLEGLTLFTLGYDTIKPIQEKNQAAVENGYLVLGYSNNWIKEDSNNDGVNELRIKHFNWIYSGEEPK